MVGTNSHIAKLKAQLDRAIIQREHWKQLAENRNSIIVTEVCPESRSVEEYIIDADSVRASWRLIREYREQIEALRAELEAIKASGWRSHSVSIKRGEKCPQNLETAQAAWDRDQELIEEQRLQIAKQKQTINDLRQKLYANPTT